MLRSRGISQIYYTYSEDKHPVYPLLPWLHTPRLRLGVTTVAEDIWVHILLVGVVYPILVHLGRKTDFSPSNCTCQSLTIHLLCIQYHHHHYRQHHRLVSPAKKYYTLVVSVKKRVYIACY